MLKHGKKSKKHNHLITTIVGFALNKISIIESIFEKTPTRIQKQVIIFLEKSRQFQKFSRVISLYFINKIEESNKLEKTKPYEQLIHENFIIGRELKNTLILKINQLRFL